MSTPGIAHPLQRPDEDRPERPLAGPSWDLSHGPLKVHENHRFLVHADGAPFLWLADTAWELFHRLDRDQVEHYLERRRQQGFTVIQAVALAEFEGLTVPNAQGHVPLVDLDPARPDVRDPRTGYDYWQHVDFVFERAAAKGLYMGFLPTWADKVGPVGWGTGPEVFTEENARTYGRFLGQRYRDTKNLIWILGGDRPLLWEGRDFRPVWRAMAEGIKEGERQGGGGVPHLMTFHPVGGQSSSYLLHEEPWLDFDMLQSGHVRRDDRNYAMVTADLARVPSKPVIDGEPRYEDHCIDFKPELGWFDAVDARNAAWRALFAGACGHTYGCHDIWQFLDEGRKPVSWARTNWKVALDLDGAWDMQHVRTLLLSRPFTNRIPDPSLIVGGQGAWEDHAEATRDVGGRYAFIYVPTGKPVTVHFSRFQGVPRIRAWWFDPRSGLTTPGGERDVIWKQERQEYTPPGPQGRGQDWVLILDDARQNFPAPGRLA
jgi:hypothetical protein